jgi:hypothetical protein
MNYFYWFKSKINYGRHSQAWVDNMLFTAIYRYYNKPIDRR